MCKIVCGKYITFSQQKLRKIKLFVFLTLKWKLLAPLVKFMTDAMGSTRRLAVVDDRERRVLMEKSPCSQHRRARDNKVRGFNEWDDGRFVLVARGGNLIYESYLLF